VESGSAGAGWDKSGSGGVGGLKKIAPRPGTRSRGEAAAAGSVLGKAPRPRAGAIEVSGRERRDHAQDASVGSRPARGAGCGSHAPDRQGGVPGTYYYDKAEHVTYSWNIFDQILVRPDLLEGLGAESVRILTSVRGLSLLGPSGRPDKAIASDNLPVLVDLDF
jgi:hypothetical protein